MAFKYLLDLGHRRIGYLGRARSLDPSITQRFEAYEHSFQRLNREADPDWVLDVRTVEQVKRTAAHWLALPAERRPTAIIVIDRFWQALPVWLEAGIEVPRQVSFVNVGGAGVVVRLPPVRLAELLGGLRTVTATDVRRPFTNTRPSWRCWPRRPSTCRPGRWGVGDGRSRPRLAIPRTGRLTHILPSELIVGNTAAPPGG